MVRFIVPFARCSFLFVLTILIYSIIEHVVFIQFDVHAKDKRQNVIKFKLLLLLLCSVQSMNNGDDNYHKKQFLFTFRYLYLGVTIPIHNEN